MKTKYFIILMFIPFLMATECHRPDNFFPDADDAGLSRFTSRGYNQASNYINDSAYRFFNTQQLLYKDSSGNGNDTLNFGWMLYPSPYLYNNSAYQNISFLIPVSTNFNKSDLLDFNNKRFVNSISVVIQNDSTSRFIKGTSTLYFVSVTEDLSYLPQKYIKLSGLFDGNIGNTVLITKGRFDFEINEDELNF